MGAAVAVLSVVGTNGGSWATGVPPDKMVECSRAGAVAPPLVVPTVTTVFMVLFRGGRGVADKPGITPGPTRTGRAVLGVALSSSRTVVVPVGTVTGEIVHMARVASLSFTSFLVGP